MTNQAAVSAAFAGPEDEIQTAEALERNKTTPVALYDLMFNESRPAEAIARYAGNTYIQHNPHVGDGEGRGLRGGCPALRQPEKCLSASR